MSGDQPTRREFSRVPVHLKAEIRADGKVYRDGTMENLSLKGGFFRTGASIQDGVAVDVRLHLDGTGIEVHTRGFVVRGSGEGFAVQFTEIVGLDSLEHLRNIILFNTHDPHRVEEEFHSHLGLKRPE
ncbi:MAG TPA: PilZ domain-containing protein [Gemmatimonadales bacterium]|nr:PilZ domain-containing protein [Gemmatimonadales bacterium]